MNILIKSGKIEEMECAGNLAYIFSDESDFAVTEYKFLHEELEDIFIPCMKMRFNGKRMILYYTENKAALESLLPSLSGPEFVQLIKKLIAEICAVKEFGFLSCCGTEASLLKIFVDKFTRDISLIYIPSKEKPYPDEAVFEEELKSSLIKAINEHENLLCSESRNLKMNLADGTLKLKDAFNPVKIKRKSSENQAVSFKKGSLSDLPGKMRLVCLSTRAPEIKITGKSFILGKQTGACDGVITFNKMISRMHCRINKGPSGYMAADLGSSNGTYVNGRRVNEDENIPLKNGDILRLANTDFRVVIE